MMMIEEMRFTDMKRRKNWLLVEGESWEEDKKMRKKKIVGGRRRTRR